MKVALKFQIICFLFFTIIQGAEAKSALYKNGYDAFKNRLFCLKLYTDVAYCIVLDWIQQKADIIKDQLARDDLLDRHQRPARWKGYFRDLKSSKLNIKQC